MLGINQLTLVEKWQSLDVNSSLSDISAELFYHTIYLLAQFIHFVLPNSLLVDTFCLWLEPYVKPVSIKAMEGKSPRGQAGGKPPSCQDTLLPLKGDKFEKKRQGWGEKFTFCDPKVLHNKYKLKRKEREKERGRYENNIIFLTLR